MVDANLVLQDLAKRLNEAFPGKIADVVLFGSHLNGDAREDSDYDFVIVWNGVVDWETKLAIYSISGETDTELDVFSHTLIIGTDELKTLRGKQPIFIDALANGRRAAA